MKILILEDDPFFAVALKAILHAHLKAIRINSEVESFGDEDSFFAAYGDDVSLVFMDYYLENSYTCESVIKKIYALNPKQKVIVISGQKDVHTVLRLIRQGIRHYIVKDEEYAKNIKGVLDEELI